MGLLDKVKNLFTEEVEVEVKEETPIKKEVIQVEIPSPAKTTRTELHNHEEEPIIKEESKKEENKFPFFDDKDFDSFEVPQEPKKEKKKPAYQKEVYNPPKEEKKVFKPSPIISPVYGILDKNYQKDDLKVKNESSSYYNAKEANLDAIRNKAYGSLDSDIDTTLFGKKRVLFDEPEDVVDTTLESLKNEEEIIENMENDNYDSTIIGEKPRHSADEDTDLTDLLEEEMSKPVEEKKTPRKISDSELFSLIDSMYENGDKK